MKEIKNHWATLADYPMESECGAYEIKDDSIYFQNEITELKNFEDWAESLSELKFGTPYLRLELNFGPDPSKYFYPMCLLKYKHELAVEFRCLLPNTPAVKAILPLLLMSYITNRRSATRSKQKKDSPVLNIEGEEEEGTVSLLRNLIVYKDKNIISYYEADQKLFRPRNWKFPSLTYMQLTKTKLANSLASFGTTVIFLYFLYKTQDICNLTLSYKLFEEYSGFLELIDKRFSDFPKEVEKDPLREEISSYINGFFSPMCEWEIISPLDIFIMHFTMELLSMKEPKGACPSEEYLKRNIWAYEKIYEPCQTYCIANGLFDCDTSICSDQMYQKILIDENIKRLQQIRKHRKKPPLKRIATPRAKSASK